jgi:hypothetical protein
MRDDIDPRRRADIGNFLTESGAWQNSKLEVA